ncbi:ABC transporter G family member 23-like isoform X2 [Cataglyphis hispanica]|uniref:ABC transporter G family member 23-like isoform X2 n=1 Tax=Cataglyphis hispanica TaxID=1086592 RepID=UPI00217F6D2A|nr:ABC transporter G family member 23-like isoform X2 [Cataglyphis hispanica]
MKMRRNPKVRSLNEQSSSFRKMVQQNAVIVRNAVKFYVPEKPILNGLNMTVPKGTIYGLLGASGCGKTTLLSCVVGVKHIDTGEIWVLGGKPGQQGSGIPGPRVGYMPQEIGLVGEFSMSGALYYFGRINGLEDEEIETRQKFLSELLQLPPANHLVKNMSGGQQRRVSFAAAMIHCPELLILDEPTVGMDPILSNNIWIYLTKITKEEGITVLITTHYIQEAKDSNVIGLMRSGKLLAESSPQELLERFQCSSLEEAFLGLCQAQNSMMLAGASQVVEPIKNTEDDACHQEEDSYKRMKDRIAEYKARLAYKVSPTRRFKALMGKNAIQFFRFYSGIIFAVIFPLLQISSFFIGVGGDPKNLKIGIINHEAGNCDYGNNIGSVLYDEENFSCHFSNLSCRFLHGYGDSIAEQKFYDDMSDATHDIRDGELVGVMYFHHNFSEALQRRTEDFVNARTEDIVSGKIDVFLDMGDMQIGQYMEKKLYERFFEIYKDVLKECKYPPKFGNIPIRFEDAVYSDMDHGYDYFVAPSFIMILLFFLSTTVSTSLIITDRSEGVWDRSLVQGVKNGEILLAHILTQTSLVIIHVTLTMILFFPIWDLVCEGSYILVFFIMFLSGLTGLMYGFFISVTCKDHTMANYASTGSFFPLIIISASIWPIEGMPDVLRYFSYCTPTTLPSIALRAVIFKGYALDKEEVFTGVLVSCAYISMLFIFVLIGLKLKS